VSIDPENHPTDTIYEDNLIAKTFCFQFINSFFNLFYVAFIKVRCVVCFWPTMRPFTGSVWARRYRERPSHDGLVLLCRSHWGYCGRLYGMHTEQRHSGG